MAIGKGVALGVLIATALIRNVNACSCASEMPQILLDRAQFVAEVTATDGTLVIDRVVRGSQSAKGLSLRGNLVLQPRDCCDRSREEVVTGQRYWLIAPEQQVDIGQTLSAEETAVADAVLKAYYGQMHGEGSRDRVAFYYRTVAPKRSELEVRVVSPANDEASRRYSNLRLRKGLLVNRRPAVINPGDPYFVTSMRESGCANLAYADAVSVSRPALDGEAALIDLEYRGGARACYLVRNGARWNVEWHVDLWQCG